MGKSAYWAPKPRSPSRRIGKKTAAHLIDSVERGRQAIVELERELAVVEGRYRAQKTSLMVARIRLDELARQEHHIRTAPQYKRSAIGRLLCSSPLTCEADAMIDAVRKEMDAPYRVLSSSLEGEISRINGNIDRLKTAISFDEKRLEPYLRKLRVESERKEKIRQAKVELSALRAVAARTTRRSRELAERLKSRLSHQDLCPYCGGSLGDKPHADHIYPLSKGGRSIESNMVLACEGCNMKKGSLTLAGFIRQEGLDRDAVEQRLRVLQKDF